MPMQGVRSSARLAAAGPNPFSAPGTTHLLFFLCLQYHAVLQPACRIWCSICVYRLTEANQTNML